MIRSIILLSALAITAGAQAAETAPCEEPAPPVSRCPARYLPPVNGAPSPSQDFINAVSEAHAAVEAERDALSRWLKSRAEFKSAVANRSKKFSDDRERDDAEKAFATALATYRTDARRYHDAKDSSDTKAAEAFRLAKVLYGLTPPKPDLNESQAIDHPLAPWGPRLSREYFDKDLGRWRLRTPEEREAEKGRRRMAGGANAPSIGLDAGLTTNYDGQIRLYGDAFDSAQTLLATVHHETSHWVDIMAIGGTRRERERLPPTEFFKSERDAYAREAEFYQKSGDKASYENRLAASRQCETQRLISERNALSWTDIKTNQTYRGWIGVDGALHRAELEDYEERGDEVAATLQEIREGARDFQARRDAEAVERVRNNGYSLAGQEDKRLVHVRMANAAIACGLELEDTWNVRFIAGQDRRIGFQFIDEEVYRASLLLYSACYADRTAPPCVDSLPTLTGNWGRPEFRKGLYLAQGSDNDAAACVASLVANLDTPKDYEALLKRRDKFWSGRRRPKPESPTTSGATPPDARPRPPREEVPRPPREDVPWCLQEPGRRCIR